MSLSKTGIPYGDLAWNPCGAGCSNIANCPTCWARAFAARGFGNCPDCRAFRVHVHHERLTAPSKRKKPATILVQFTGDLFDACRSGHETYQVLDAAYAAPQHTYVFLTQQPHNAHVRLVQWALDGPMPHDARRLPGNWIIGQTLKTDEQARACVDAFAAIPGRRWLSLEPIMDAIDLGPYLRAGIEGVVLGADNQPCVPFQAAWMHAAISQVTACNADRPAAERPVAVYVKQLWTWRCPNCGYCHMYGPSVRCPCGTPGNQKLYTLATDLNQFPESLRYRALPWPLHTK